MHTSVSEEMEPQPNSNNYDNSKSGTMEKTILTRASKINISLVDAVTYSKVCDSPGTQEFCLCLVSNDISAHTSSISNSPPIDLSNILEEYHNFVDVFDKAEVDMLALHRTYNLKVNLEGDSVPQLQTL